jgi:hypothetical protein
VKTEIREQEEGLQKSEVRVSKGTPSRVKWFSCWEMVVCFVKGEYWTLRQALSEYI